jgi:RNA polymerase sigma factor (sigma-70 family)
MADEAAYNKRQMLRQDSSCPESELSSRLHPVELFSRCAADRSDAAVWAEFLRRYVPKIKYFIRGTLRRTFGTESDPGVSVVRGAVQETDLVQNFILRLVQNECAVMRRFSGTTEDELLAYLAVITRSVVIDTLRQQRIFHGGAHAPEARPSDNPENNCRYSDMADDSDLERGILARELASLAQQTLKCLSGPAWSRDKLVCNLYFTHNLSFRQIAECKGINLTKGGVEKLLNRLIDRVRTSAAAQVQGKM